MSPFHVIEFEAYFAPLPEVGCPKFLKILNPWGKVLERSGRLGSGLNSPHKKRLYFADFAVQNMVETTLPDGLEISGQRVYR